MRIVTISTRLETSKTSVLSLRYVFSFSRIEPFPIMC